MVEGHVTPIDHRYFFIKGAMATPPQPTPDYAPMDGNVSSVTRTVRNGDPAGSATATYDDYAITVEATCTFRVRFSNMLRFAGMLGDNIGVLQANQTKLPNHPVKAGELMDGGECGTRTRGGGFASPTERSTNVRAGPCCIRIADGRPPRSAQNLLDSGALPSPLPSTATRSWRSSG